MNKNLYVFFIIACFYFSSFSQTGPGGVGSTSSNVVWLKSEDISSLLDGDDVSSWLDLSGNGNDVSQPVPSFTPVYKTNILNGFPVVRFEKTNGRLRKTSFSSFPTSEITTIHVNKTTDRNEGVLSYASSASNNDFLLFSSNNLKLYRGSSNISSGIAFNDGSFHITNASWQSSGGAIEIWKDGAKDYTGTKSSGTTITAGGSFAIAGEQDTVDGGYDSSQAHFGDFTEVLVFNTFLNEAQQIIIANYLAAKYDLTISNDRYAYQATHSYDVAGIGRESLTDTHLIAMSDAILQLQNASGIDADQEYVLFGHDNQDVTTAWTTTEAPDSGINIQRLAREWRLDETGTIGSIGIVVDVATMPTLPIDYTTYALMTDADGDFSSGANVYEMTFVSGTNYTVTGVNFTDGDHIAIAAVNPKIQHTTTTGSGAESSNASIEISLNFIPATDKTVEFTTADISTTAGADYTAAIATTATILAGNTTANYTILVTDDVDPESTETFTSTLSSPSSGLSLGTNTVFTYSISDNDISKKVSFDSASANDNESESLITVNLSINMVDALNPTSVDYTVTGGTATGSGTDYTFTAGTVTFPAGITTRSFSFIVNNDTLYETNETIIIGLSNPVNCNLDDTEPFIGAGITYTYTINDNDANPIIQFTTNSSTGAESITSVNFEVNIDVTSGIDASATYTVTGTANGGGVDYTLANGIVTIPAGSTTANIAAVIFDDDEIEMDETIIITVSSPINATLGANIIHTYTILNNDILGYTGPGGVGDSATNIVWLDADKISTLSEDDDITSWSDISGNSNNFSESALFSPIYKTNIVNGFSTARFNKTTNRIRKTSFTEFISTAVTTIFVNKNNGETGDAHLSYASSASNNDFLLFNSTNLQLHIAGTSATSGVSVNDNNWHIINASWQSSGGNYEIWKDGTEAATGTVSSGATITSGGTLALAGEQDSVDGGYTDSQAHSGDYPEVIMYNVYLNTVQQIIISNYLSAKYNVAISNDFYTQDAIENGDFDTNVAGIGRATDGSFHTDSQGNGIIRMHSPSSLDNDDYLFWGRNNTTAYSFTTNTNNYKERLSSNWRVSKRNDLGTTTLEVDMTGVDLSGKQDCATLQLIVDNNADLLSPTTTHTLTNTTGNIYQATGISFINGDYFTIEYLDAIVLDDTQFYNGTGPGNVPDITNNCYKLLVKNTATGAITLPENANVRAIEIETGGKLAINTGTRLQVENGINNSGEIRLIGTSQLIQTHATTTQISGTGLLYKDQTATTSTVYQSGYWSSPVTTNGSTFTINDVLKDGTVATTAIASPGAATDITFTSVHIFDGSSSPAIVSGRWLAKLVNDLDWTRQISPTSQIFNPSEGWNMKSVGGSFTFKGIPNDGIYTSIIDQDRLSLIGNPYASAIDADQFITDNAAAFNGVLYFYDGTNDNTHRKEDYTGGYHTRVNGVSTPEETTTISGSNYYIPVGQAFFVTRDAVGSGTITFNNSQRVFHTIGSESIFFGKKESKNTEAIPLMRLGFSFTIEAEQVYKRELAIAFRGLTNNYEAGYDAEMFDKQPSDLALKVTDKTTPFVISGVDHLDEEMEIPLFLYLDKERTVTFHLKSLENLNASVYLYDQVTLQTHNITNTPVDLALPAGEYNDRFLIIFQNRSAMSLSNEDSLLSEGFKYYFDNETKELVIKLAQDTALNSLKVFSVLGQKILDWRNTQPQQTEHKIKVPQLQNGLYIFQFNLSNGVFAKKIIIQH